MDKKPVIDKVAGRRIKKLMKGKKGKGIGPEQFPK